MNYAAPIPAWRQARDVFIAGRDDLDVVVLVYDNATAEKLHIGPPPAHPVRRPTRFDAEVKVPPKASDFPAPELPPDHAPVWTESIPNDYKDTLAQIAEEIWYRTREPEHDLKGNVALLTADKEPSWSHLGTLDDVNFEDMLARSNQAVLVRFHLANCILKYAEAGYSLETWTRAAMEDAGLTALPAAERAALRAQADAVWEEISARNGWPSKHVTSAREDASI